ncbi:MAG: hypothetical protein NZL96_02455 [Patescibacteria group bacterium]|nr:hypothetical protein [Patescibacteria group bacterium]
MKRLFFCSRLSPYLSWGNLSSRYVYQAAKTHPNNQKTKINIDAFLSRIYLRSNFIQKLESMPKYEITNINPAF